MGRWCKIHFFSYLHDEFDSMSYSVNAMAAEICDPRQLCFSLQMKCWSEFAFERRLLLLFSFYLFAKIYHFGVQQKTLFFIAVYRPRKESNAQFSEKEFGKFSSRLKNWITLIQKQILKVFGFVNFYALCCCVSYTPRRKNI